MHRVTWTEAICQPCHIVRVRSALLATCLICHVVAWADGVESRSAGT